MKRKVLEELGAFDERYQIGGLEDVDLCYRMRREGYRILVAQKSYIHHIGSQTFSELQSKIDLQQIFRTNDVLYDNKWASDVACGFVSHLPTRGRGRVTFDESKRPKAATVSPEAVALADIALCMIVKNEEKSIAECLASVKPFVTQMNVLDTGSTDNTIEILRTCGAIVNESPWQDSFAVARTQSMAGITSKWILWVDADDTLPPECGKTIVEAVLSAPAVWWDLSSPFASLRTSRTALKLITSK